MRNIARQAAARTDLVSVPADLLGQASRIKSLFARRLYLAALLSCFGGRELPQVRSILDLCKVLRTRRAAGLWVKRQFRDCPFFSPCIPSLIPRSIKYCKYLIDAWRRALSMAKLREALAKHESSGPFLEVRTEPDAQDAQDGGKLLWYARAGALPWAWLARSVDVLGLDVLEGLYRGLTCPRSLLGRRIDNVAAYFVRAVRYLLEGVRAGKAIKWARSSLSGTIPVLAYSRPGAGRSWRDPY